jgi:Cd2+/Zn2+-exporting ATPase/Cu+-exporting ATPase
VSIDDRLVGVLAAADTLRAEVPQALDDMRALGIEQIELLTGDNERTAAALAQEIGVRYRANLLPASKIEAVRAYQADGQRVMMVGDGVNDAPALAQADVGVAMGAAGTDVAIEAAHVALMREDWALVPEAVRIARRTMRVVKMNLGFTALYNVVGLALAAWPPRRSRCRTWGSSPIRRAFSASGDSVGRAFSPPLLFGAIRLWAM